MARTHDILRKHTGTGFKRCDSRIYAKLHNTARKNRCRIEVRKRCCGRRVGKIVRRDIYSLHRCDRAVFRGNNTLLQFTHFRSKRRLIANCGGHSAQKRRNLASRLGKAEYVIYEKKNILVGIFAEVFGNGKPGKRNTQPCAGGFVHLPEHECGFADNAGFLHFVPKIVALARALAHAGKHRIPVVFEGYIADELHY